MSDYLNTESVLSKVYDNNAINAKIAKAVEALKYKGVINDQGGDHVAYALKHAAMNMFSARAAGRYDGMLAISGEMAKIKGLSSFSAKDIHLDRSGRVHFSAGPNDAAALTSMTAIDATVYAQLKSFYTRIAIERGMSDETINITFQNLVSINAAGGYDVGETGVDSRVPITPFKGKGFFTDSSANDITAIDATQDIQHVPPVGGSLKTFGRPIVKGSVRVYATDSTNTLPNKLIGTDEAKNGQISFTQPVGKMRVTYSDGYLYLSPMTIVDRITDNDGQPEAYDGFVVVASSDILGDSTGTKLARFTPVTDNVIITAKDMSLSIETNIQNVQKRLKMNLETLGGGINVNSYIATASQQLLSLYVKQLNDMAVECAAQAAATQAPLVPDFDVTQFSLAQSYAPTRQLYLEKMD